jgi:hypothetical protein
MGQIGWRPDCAGMPYAVLCGAAKNPPDHIVGPFETSEDAEQWIAEQTPQPGRYMVSMALTAPEGRQL